MSESGSTPTDSVLIAATDPIQMEGLFYTVAELRQQMSPIGYMTPADQLNAAAAAAAQATANAAIPYSILGQSLGPVQLDASNKVPIANLPASVFGSSHYIGVWNAQTNTPLIVSGTAPNVPSPTGGYYIVGVAGTPTIDGISVWNAGDWIIWSGTAWNNISGQINPVSSVAGLQGAVTTSQLATALVGTMGLSSTGGQLNVTFGSTANTAAMGNDSRITGALQATHNLSEIASASAARTHLGLSSVAISAFNSAAGPPQLDGNSNLSNQTFGLNGSACTKLSDLHAFTRPGGFVDQQSIATQCFATSGDNGGGIFTVATGGGGVPDQYINICPASLLAAAVTTGTIFTGDGSTTQFSFTLPNFPIVPASQFCPVPVSVKIGPVTMVDQGNGTMTGNGLAAPASIDYATGVCFASFTTAPANNAKAINNAYSYAGSTVRHQLRHKGSISLSQVGASNLGATGPDAAPAINQAINLSIVTGLRVLGDAVSYNLGSTINYDPTYADVDFQGATLIPTFTAGNVISVNSNAFFSGSPAGQYNYTRSLKNFTIIGPSNGISGSLIGIFVAGTNIVTGQGKRNEAAGAVIENYCIAQCGIGIQFGSAAYLTDFGRGIITNCGIGINVPVETYTNGGENMTFGKTFIEQCGIGIFCSTEFELVFSAISVDYFATNAIVCSSGGVVRAQQWHIEANTDAGYWLQTIGADCYITLGDGSFWLGELATAKSNYPIGYCDNASSHINFGVVDFGGAGAANNPNLYPLYNFNYLIQGTGTFGGWSDTNYQTEGIVPFSNSNLFRNGAFASSTNFDWVESGTGTCAITDIHSWNGINRSLGQNPPAGLTCVENFTAIVGPNAFCQFAFRLLTVGIGGDIVEASVVFLDQQFNPLTSPATVTLTASGTTPQTEVPVAWTRYYLASPSFSPPGTQYLQIAIQKTGPSGAGSDGIGQAYWGDLFAYSTTGGFPQQLTLYANGKTVKTALAITPGLFTVTTLPVTGISKGTRATVSDAISAAFLAPLTGGGTITCPAMYNGSAWVAG